MLDYYKILQVKQDATQKEIKEAYRNLAKKYHPDMPGGDASKFQQVKDAYIVIGESQSRKKYDERLVRVNNGTMSKKSSGSNTPTGEFKMDDMQQRFEQFFSFKPKTSSQNKNNNKKNNPLDTSKMFNSYFGTNKPKWVES